MKPAIDQFITIDNVNIHAEFYPCTEGEATETFVLIHGYLSSAFSFRRLIPLLTRKYAVATLDLPGFGQSEKPKSFMYSMANYGKLIVSFLQQCQLDQVMLAGHSMGGQVALQVAKQAPQRVKKLILLASSGYLKPFSRRLVFLSYLPFFAWLVRRTFEKKDPKAILQEVVYDPAIIDEDMINSYTRPMQTKDFYNGEIGLLRYHGGDLKKEELAAIKTSALLLWGQEDRIVPLETGKRLAEDLPDTTLKIYENTGHLLPEEKPEDVYRDIQDFL